MCDPTPHQTAILSACASQPLSTLHSLLSTSPDDPAPHAKHMAKTAAEHGNASVLAHLILTAPAPALEPRTSLLFLAAAAHSRPCVEIMLSDQGGCHIDARDDGGNVLDWALGRAGCPDEFVAWLLERGARAERGDDGDGGGGGGPGDDDDDDDDGVPENAFCLAGAVARGSVAIMRMLVAHGAEVDASRALHTAVALGYVQKVRFLVEEVGADVNGPPGWCRRRWGSDGIRGPGKPLHRAAEKGYGGLVEYLLEHGARMDARDGVGRTPFQVAFANRRENVMAILKGRGGSTELGIGMIEYTEGYRTRMFV